MKKNLTIATFISNSEIYNNELDKIVNYLLPYYNLEVYVFTDKNISNVNTKYNVIIKKENKLNRIVRVINKTKNEHILFFDNDVILFEDKIKEFIEKCLSVDYSIAWGKIKSKNIRTLSSHLVEIDKNLSHDILRPISWKFNFGVSLPGQIFMLNKDYYKEKLYCIDTVYDDLQIGAVTKENHFPIYFVSDIIGLEEPKQKLNDLILQRKRWALGLAEVIHINKNKPSKKYIIMHGLIYNLLWLPYNIVVVLTLLYNPIISIALLIITATLLSSKKINNFIYAIIYLLFFWIIYIIWLFNFIHYLIKVYKKGEFYENE